MGVFVCGGGWYVCACVCVCVCEGVCISVLFYMGLLRVCVCVCLGACVLACVCERGDPFLFLWLHVVV